MGQLCRQQARKDCFRDVMLTKLKFPNIWTDCSHKSSCFQSTWISGEYCFGATWTCPHGHHLKLNPNKIHRPNYYKEWKDYLCPESRQDKDKGVVIEESILEKLMLTLVCYCSFEMWWYKERNKLLIFKR
jgi:hypothetical protein